MGVPLLWFALVTLGAEARVLQAESKAQARPQSADPLADLAPALDALHAAVGPPGRWPRWRRRQAIRALRSLAAEGGLLADAFQAAAPAARAAAHRRAGVVRAAEDTDTEKRPGGPLPFFQSRVPEDQTPTFELQNLKRQPFQDWPQDEEYGGKLLQLYYAINLFASLPVAYVTYDNLPAELPQLLLSANIGTLAAMLPFIARLRVGWGFVSQRLKEKSTYFEAQQRGLFARKDRGTELRDRLVEKSEVQPTLGRIDRSIAAVVLALFLSVGSGETLTLALGEAGPSTLKALSGDEAIRFENRLKADENFAKREQERAQRKFDEDLSNAQPLYCQSRYYKILAGGNSQGGVGCGGE